MPILFAVAAQMLPLTAPCRILSMAEDVLRLSMLRRFEARVPMAHFECRCAWWIRQQITLIGLVYRYSGAFFFGSRATQLLDLSDTFGQRIFSANFAR